VLVTPRWARHSIPRRRSIDATATARGRHTGCHGSTAATRSTALPIRRISSEGAAATTSRLVGCARPSNDAVRVLGFSSRRTLAVARKAVASAAKVRRLIGARDTGPV
jgi:hypothetical protein